MANSSVAWAFRAPRLAGITSASGLGRHAHTSSACRVPAFLSCIAWVVVRREPPRGVFPAPRQAADNTAEADTLYFWSESTYTHTHTHTHIHHSSMCKALHLQSCSACWGAFVVERVGSVLRMDHNDLSTESCYVRVYPALLLI